MSAMGAMGLVRANIANEWHKLWAKRKIKFLLGLTVLVPLLGAFSLERLQGAFGILAVDGADYPLTILGLFTLVILPLTAFQLATELFPAEVAARTLKLTLLQPISRWNVFLSKVLTIGLVLAVQLGVLWAVSTAAGLWVQAEGLANGIGNGLIAHAAAWVPVFAVACLAVLVVQGFRSATGALMTLIVLFLAAKALPFVVPEVAVFLPFTYSDWHLLWTEGGVAFGTLLNGFLLLASCCIVTYIAGYTLFERKEV